MNHVQSPGEHAAADVKVSHSTNFEKTQQGNLLVKPCPNLHPECAGIVLAIIHRILRYRCTGRPARSISAIAGSVPDRHDSRPEPDPSRCLSSRAEVKHLGARGDESEAARKRTQQRRLGALPWPCKVPALPPPPPPLPGFPTKVRAADACSWSSPDIPDVSILPAGELVYSNLV